MKTRNLLLEQILPLFLTFISFLIFGVLIFCVIILLNSVSSTDISTQIRWSDIFVGMTIYLKTSVDFAIFIGNLMNSYPGWKNRIAIEIGTAAGNTLGTIAILTIWNFFRSIELLLAIMVLIASLVLFRLASDGLEHTGIGGNKLPQHIRPFAKFFEKLLSTINHITHPLLRRILPGISMKPTTSKTWAGLLFSSFSVPFILGLDDFAGYVPLFNIVNVFGFAIGVILGHMILNIFLFVSPQKTMSAVKIPLVSFFGSLAFFILGMWGLYEVVKILFVHS